MTRLKMGPGLATAAIAAIVVASPAAAAEYYVPPGNSAATQYTEAFPAAGGNRNAEREDASRRRSPSRVLGERSARRLEARGPEGRSVAELVVATSPPEGDAGEAESPAATQRDEPAEERERELGSVGTAPQGGGPSGSSGLAEVLAQTFGASPAGGAGTLLPLALLATIAWSVAYLWRRQRKLGT